MEVQSHSALLSDQLGAANVQLARLEAERTNPHSDDGEQDGFGDGAAVSKLRVEVDKLRAAVQVSQVG